MPALRGMEIEVVATIAQIQKRRAAGKGSCGQVNVVPANLAPFHAPSALSRLSYKLQLMSLMLTRVSVLALGQTRKIPEPESRSSALLCTSLDRRAIKGGAL